MFRQEPGITWPPIKITMLVSVLLPLVLLVESCRPVSPNHNSGIDLDLTGRFEMVTGDRNKSPDGKSFTRHYSVVRKGQRRDAMVLVAPVAIRASLGGISGRICLKGLAAPVFNIGDGVQMDICLIGPEPARKVFSRYFDPGRVEHDRAWIPFEIPLDLDGAESRQLEIRAAGGPHGDHVADWLAVSSLIVSPLCGQE